MKVKKILVSQPEPADLEKSPYKNLVTKYGVDITFFKFFEVVGLSVSEFRKVGTVRIDRENHRIFLNSPFLYNMICCEERILISWRNTSSITAPMHGSSGDDPDDDPERPVREAM